MVPVLMQTRDHVPPLDHRGPAASLAARWPPSDRPAGTEDEQVVVELGHVPASAGVVRVMQVVAGSRGRVLTPERHPVTWRGVVPGTTSAGHGFGRTAWTAAGCASYGRSAPPSDSRTKATTVRTYTQARRVERRWHVIDASDVVLGRLASRPRSCSGQAQAHVRPHIDTGTSWSSSRRKVALTGPSASRRRPTGTRLPGACVR